MLHALARIKEKKATGHDEISAIMLKRCFITIADRLATLFNLSFKIGEIPQDWKKSRITPIPKPGDDLLVSNYRPISILPLVAKVQERIVHEALVQHILYQGTLSDKQFGWKC